MHKLHSNTLRVIFCLSHTLYCFTVFALLRGLQNLFKRSLDKRYISVCTSRVKECFKSLTNCRIPCIRNKRICLLEELEISDTLARFTTAGYKKILLETTASYLAQKATENTAENYKAFRNGYFYFCCCFCCRFHCSSCHLLLSPLLLLLFLLPPFFSTPLLLLCLVFCVTWLGAFRSARMIC